MSVTLTPLGTYQTGVFDEGAAEINAYDPSSQRLFVVNANATTVDVLDVSDPTQPTLINTIDASALGGGANSVAVNNGLLAVAIEAETVTDLGSVAFFDATSGALLSQVTVGALPDMVTFTPDGSKLLVANEGEASDGVDPEGSISIIDLSGGVAALTDANVMTADFKAYNGRENDLRGDGVRIFPDASVAQDFEPEYIAVSPDGEKAFVTLQEANAVAVVEIATATVAEIQPLGVKDHAVAGNGLDASDRDGSINIRNWPVYGLYMPDAIASYEVNGTTYYVTANEGDDRGDADEAGRGDAIRLKDLGDVVSFDRNGLVLDERFDPALLEDENLGRLTISSIDGDLDGDGDLDQIFAYGSRSFSIFDENGNLVFDSGSQFEEITAQLFPNDFNATNDENGSFENRSDNKGPEPEGVVLGVVEGKTYAFIGLERIGGVMVYDISNPAAAEFVQYINPRDFSGDAEAGTAGDLGPEGLSFISADDSPNGKALLAVSNEISGSTTLYEVNPGGSGGSGGSSGGSGGGSDEDTTFTLELLHAADQEGGIPALTDAPNFSAVLNALKAQDIGNDGQPDNTLVLSSGDAIIPGVFFSASAEAFGGAGRADILIQNELGFQAIAFGNHEFDLGTGLLRDLIGGATDDPATPENEAFAGTAFPYLSSNLDFSTDANLADLVVDDGQAPQGNSIAASTVIEVNGEKIGVVGATTPTISNVNVRISSPGDVTVLPQPFDGTPTAEQLDALAAEIQADVDALLAANPEVNKVVLLAHMQQIALEQQLAARLSNVDIIVAGGSNTRLVDETDVLRPGDSNQGVYPIITTDADGKPVAVVNTDGNYKYVGRLVIDFDANGNIIPGSYDPTVSGAYATDAAGVAALGAEGLVDPEIQAIVDALEAEIIAKESNVFGSSEVFLNGTRASVRTEETNLGNLSADANLAYARSIDPTVTISIKNGGGIRDDIGRKIVPAGGTGEPELLPTEAIPAANKPEGGISENDIANTLRFNNGLTLVTVTAAELAALIEHGVSASGEGATPGQFPQVAGIRFSFDDDLPGGDRVQSLVVLDEAGEVADVVIQNGELVGDVGRSFRLVTLNFLAGGGDGYPFPTGDSANLVELTQPEEAARTGAATFAADGSEQDALAEYLVANFSDEAFMMADVGPELDLRIQNLDFREDSVIPTEFGSGSGSGSGGDNGGGFEPPIFPNAITGTGNLFGSSEDEDFVAAGDGVVVYAGEGNNRVLGLGAGLIVYGGSGQDEITLTAGDNLVYGAEGVNTIITGDGDDIIYGGSSGDLIQSGSGDDVIYAAEGDNRIDAGAGFNIVYAGSGADTFVLSDMGMTEVIGFGANDRIETGGLDAVATRQNGDTLISLASVPVMVLKWFAGEVSLL